MKTTARRTLITITALIALLATACGGGKPNPADITATPEPASIEDSSAPGDDSDTRDISALDSGLDALKSYRQHFTYSYEGKDDKGESRTWMVQFEQEVINDAKEHHIKSATSGATANGEPSTFELFVVDGATYMYSVDSSGAASCFSFSSEESKSQAPNLLQPTDVIGGIESARLLQRSENVNGITADHYIFDENSISFGAFSAVKGDAWVAVEGGYLVKYSAQATGKAGIGAVLAQGDLAEGKIAWDYSLSDVNRVDRLALPQACEAQKPATDIPLPTNATEQASFGSTISFKSPDAPADVAAFFRRELPAQGWTAGEESAVEEIVTLAFAKEQRSLTILITKDENGSGVLITESR